MTPTTYHNGIGDMRSVLGRSTRNAANEEQVVIERCKSGDQSAWDVMVRRYEKPLTNYAFSLCHNYDDANDIVSQVFLRLYQHIGDYHHGRNFHTWLYKIARNGFLDQCIRPVYKKNTTVFASLRGAEDESAFDSAADPAASPEVCCLRKETGRLLRNAVNHLPAQQRRAVRLYYLDDRSYDEIAGLTNVSVGTVKSRMKRARYTFREQMSDHPGAE